MTGLEAIPFETIAKSIITKASPKIFDAIVERVSKETMKVRVHFTKTFQGHLARSLERSANIRTIVSRDKPVSLEEIYVPLYVQCDDDAGIPDTKLNPCSAEGIRYVLSGTGGAGKTVLMKHLLNESVNNEIGFVPLFIELRNLQFDKAQSLQTCIYDELKLYGDPESMEFFEIALEEGLFAIFLDGFDEIHPEEQEHALKLIRRFADQFPKSSMLVSTRPRTAVETLRDFSIFHIEPLNKEQAVELIEKTEFEPITKEKFLNSLKSGLYE